MTTYTKTIIKVSVHSDSDNPIFGETSTHLSIEDDAAGPYLKLAQCNDVTENGVVTFNDMDHLTAVYEAAKELLAGANYK